MSAFTTVNSAAPATAVPVETSDVTVANTISAQPAATPYLDDDDDSVLSDVPHDEPIPPGMEMDGLIEHHAGHHDHLEHPDHATDEPNPKKRKRYNDPPNEVHAELRRPQLPSQWYSKTPEQWDELSHLHKLIYSHVGRIEETDLGEEVEPCEACRKRGFKCMKYKQDHPEVEKLYKGNVRVGTSCTRCRRYRRTCALPGKKPNGIVTTPNRPQSNGYGMPPGTAGSNLEQDPSGLDTWENTLLAAASGGSPLTSVASSPVEYNEPPPDPLPPPAHPQPVPQHREVRRAPNHHHHPGQPGISAPDLDEVSMAVNKVAFLDKVKAVEDELNNLRATQADFNKERRHWHDQKRDLEAEIFHLREEYRKTRAENSALQSKITLTEKDALAGKGLDMDRIMAEAELKVENRQLTGRVDVLNAEHKELKTKIKALKKDKKILKRRIEEKGSGGANNGVVDDSSSDSDSDSSDSDSSDTSIDENTRVVFDESEGTAMRDVH